MNILNNVKAFANAVTTIVGIYFVCSACAEFGRRQERKRIRNRRCNCKCDVKQ